MMDTYHYVFIKIQNWSLMNLGNYERGWKYYPNMFIDGNKCTTRVKDVDSGEYSACECMRREPKQKKKKNAQFWMWLVIEAKSDAVKSYIAQESGLLCPWIKANWT